jgi:hypothetical protein
MGPVKIDYASPDSKPKASVAGLIGQMISFVICLAAGLFFALALFIAFTFHSTDPVDPAKAVTFGLPIAVLDGLFFVGAFRCLRKIVRR